MNKLICILLALTLLLLPVNTIALAEPVNLGFMMSPPIEWLPVYGDSTCFFANDYSGASGDPEACRAADGVNWYSIKTGEIRREPPSNSNSNSSEPYRPIADECIEDGGYSLSKGSYIENSSIVGSPCDPVDFCSDPSSTDAVVRDHCRAIWSDVDDCLNAEGVERYPGCSLEEGEQEPYVCTGLDFLGNRVICPEYLEEQEESGEQPTLPLPIFGEENDGTSSGEGQGQGDEQQPRPLFGGDQFFNEDNDNDNDGDSGGSDSSDNEDSGEESTQPQPQFGE